MRWADDHAWCMHWDGTADGTMRDAMQLGRTTTQDAWLGFSWIVHRSGWKPCWFDRRMDFCIVHYSSSYTYCYCSEQSSMHGHEDMRLSSAGTHLSIHWWGGLWLAVGRIWQRFGRQQPPGIAHAVIATCMEIDRCDVVGTAWLWMHHPSTYYRLQLASRLYILDVDGMHKLSYNISLHSRRTSV
jgi:hypothetical protein